VQEQRDFLEQVGVDVLVEYPFARLRDLEAEEFVRRVLGEQLKARSVICGTDFRFGRNRQGDAEMLARLSAELGYQLTVVPKLYDGEREISSTEIRSRLQQGDLSGVNRMLGFAYPICGAVQEGKKMGREFGFPTINLVPAAEKLLPPNGVYTSRVEIDGQLYYGVTDVGRKPTIEGKNPRGVETHLLNTQGNFYGKWAQVQLLSFLRTEQRFADKEALCRQVEADIREAKAFFRLPH